MPFNWAPVQTWPPRAPRIDGADAPPTASRTPSRPAPPPRDAAPTAPPVVRSTALPAGPRLRLLVLTCMDARLDPLAALGLDRGDADVLRNAGGVVTSDVLRSVAASQQARATDRIALLLHSGCPLTGTEDPVRSAIEAARALRASPSVASATQVRAFRYDLDAHRLVEVPLDGGA